VYIEAMAASAENVSPSPGPAASASAEETEKVLCWLDSPGVRLVTIEGEWTCPVHGAGGARDTLRADPTAYHDVVSFDEPYDPRLRHRPPVAPLVVPTTLVGAKSLVAPMALPARLEP
jgi:DNA polymerase-3 subunit epsilon